MLFNNGSQDSNSCSVGPSIWYVVGSSLNHRQGKVGECHISSLSETVVRKTMFETFDQLGTAAWAGLNATEIPNHNWSMRLFQCCLFSKANISWIRIGQQILNPNGSMGNLFCDHRLNFHALPDEIKTRQEEKMCSRTNKHRLKRLTSETCLNSFEFGHLESVLDVSGNWSLRHYPVH